jgi:hypothetical protein
MGRTRRLTSRLRNQPASPWIKLSVCEYFLIGSCFSQFVTRVPFHFFLSAGTLWGPYSPTSLHAHAAAPRTRAFPPPLPRSRRAAPCHTRFPALLLHHPLPSAASVPLRLATSSIPASRYSSRLLAVCALLLLITTSIPASARPPCSSDRFHAAQVLLYIMTTSIPASSTPS